MAGTNDAEDEAITATNNGSGSGKGFDISVARQKNVTDPVELSRLNGYKVHVGVIHIAGEGDVVLHFSGVQGEARLLVESTLLVTQSNYFRSLLDPSRGFAEAQKLGAAARRATEHLPVIDVDFPSDPALDEGEWPINVVRLAHFLSILHDGRYILDGPEIHKTDDLFYLAICWDRFVVNRGLKVSSGIQSVAKSKSKRRLYQPTGLDWPSWELRHEIECRKLIFAAYRLGFRDHLAVLTQKLIVMGSVVHNHWLTGDDVEGFESVIWHLPASLEEEIFTRRRTVLAKFSVTLDRYIAQYTTGTLQCRFGYGNSNACDIFQLGQMLRFFKRKQVAEIKIAPIPLGTTIAQSMSEDSVVGLIKCLRAIPDAQIDANHQHCGIRKDLIPLLDGFEAAIYRERYIGICGTCWESGWRGAHWAEPDESTQAAGKACQDIQSHMKGKAAFAEGLPDAIADFDLRPL